VHWNGLVQVAHPSNSGVVRIRIGRSRALLAALLVAHGGAAAALLLVSGPWWAGAGLAMVLLSSAAVSLIRHFGKGRRRVRELVMRADGGFEVLTEAGGEPAALRYVSLAEPWLTVFGVRGASGRRHDILLLQDNVDAEPFRRLRVRLRQSARTEPADADAS
jgi:hypothetical protein